MYLCIFSFEKGEEFRDIINVLYNHWDGDISDHPPILRESTTLLKRFLHGYQEGGISNKNYNRLY